MVLLHVKRGDESQFLLEAPGSTELEELTVRVARVYNGRLKVQRVCAGAAAGCGGRDPRAVPLRPGLGRGQGSLSLPRWAPGRRGWRVPGGRRVQRPPRAPRLTPTWTLPRRDAHQAWRCGVQTGASPK